MRDGKPTRGALELIQLRAWGVSRTQHREREAGQREGGAARSEGEKPDEEGRSQAQQAHCGGETGLGVSSSHTLPE